ncbi:MAG: Cell wall alpha-1,3-glucan synthase ags1 [Chrysothrix sp. TS-e1954]|nr:MAG: Cell wall alpha-1,3-glucan synthase ags1 [Chrysothrix sp. TS-e1954]
MLPDHGLRQLPRLLLLLCIWLVSKTAFAYRYVPELENWNLNENQYALSPLQYSGEWPDHTFTPSPTNWRFPFYTIMLDRFVNGDPNNDDINGTVFEHDPRSNQMRHGGDIRGAHDSLDYIQGGGFKGIYLAGSPFINLPWAYDGYSPVDLTILDQHWGVIQDWRDFIDDVHSRGMYIVLDNTFATLSDLIGFEGYLNTTTPFSVDEHQVLYKTTRQYYDFAFGNTYNETCSYPRFYNETGFRVDNSVDQELRGCYDSDFDQYGDTEAFGVFPDWRRELTKFASVQDRLREWHPPVRAKIEVFYCMLIAQLDVDGFRYDKATQSTVDAMGSMNNAMRQCARGYNKTNFFTPGEITGGNDFGSIFIGRGRQPDMLPSSLLAAVNGSNQTTGQFTIRDPGYSALDSAAFHYTVYRTLTRFLGMDGNLEAGYDAPLNWVDMWNTFLLTNDFINAETGEFDPRHLYGVTNQDVFRWPAVVNGTQRQLLGHFVTSLLLPGGAPLVLYGEEQAFYVLDNTADNYIFGRGPMSSATAWQDHGCYSLDSAQYYHWPVGAARHGCSDEYVSYDHRDPSAPVRNALKHMFNLRQIYTVLNDGFYLQQLSNMTENVVYPGSSGVVTETGMWSVLRSGFPGVQDFSTSPQSNASFTNLNQTGDTSNGASVWMLYSNVNASKSFAFDCDNGDTSLDTTALVAPFPSGSTVRNILPPFDEITLRRGAVKLGLDGSTQSNGCLERLDMATYEFRAYVLSQYWQPPQPMITKFTPGHDARLLSTVGSDQTESIDISLEFSVPMDCDSITNSLNFSSAVNAVGLPTVRIDSVSCDAVSSSTVPDWSGAIHSAWAWSAKLDNVANGIHSISLKNASDVTGSAFTNTVDNFMIRIGQANNPMVFRAANYSDTLFTSQPDNRFAISHAATGADLWRYSTNWGSSFSYWMPYEGGVTPISMLPWNGTALQKWTGEHVRVEYWSRLSGSSDHIQEGDLDSATQVPRRFPHLFLEGPFNQYGFDAGPSNSFSLKNSGNWEFYFLTEWPSIAQVNVWGLNPDKTPDHTSVFGDIDQDSVLDRLPPSQLAPAVLNITQPPPTSNVAWLVQIDDSTLRYNLLPAGHATWQLALYILLWIVPFLAACGAVWLYLKSFYGVKFEKFGLVQRASLLTSFLKKIRPKKQSAVNVEAAPEELGRTASGTVEVFQQSRIDLSRVNPTVTDTDDTPKPRRTVLIATMEYDISDWEIKVKIGGLGVMAQLMGANLSHQDLVWVIPCVSGIEYPMDQRAEPMTVKILGKSFKVEVQYHKLKNITYVLLDAPTFRQQSKAEPYPARMDDMSSSIYYSAWNQCIAQAVERFPIDLYHINDYHGCIAPLYLLPRTIPVCLSLHNAEFQGLWPMKTAQECEEISGVFNIPTVFVQQYVQFGEVFNLLHAGASYLRSFQQGFGAVGVSKKYGTRSYLRYPIFWGLKKVGQLPNPDPSDTGAWDKKLPKDKDITVDPEFEAKRPGLKAQAQEWADLEQNPDAELFVFVGRWSVQKGIDLIADVFPAILEAHKNVQLLCVGPVIDLHGKFAAAKLAQMMKIYPRRVCSKPVFTALPPFVFSGADFALIPSRDEPFGLVAVEFGRKGALGVGARVGGLGQMPGWWFTVESMQTSHLLSQFKLAINEAIESKQSTRAKMRARSAKQRFPVAQWVEDLEILQSTAIKIHRKKAYELLEGDPTVPKPPHVQKRLQRRPRYDRKTTEEMMFERNMQMRRPRTDPFPSETSSIVSVAGAEPQLMERQLYSNFADEGHTDEDFDSMSEPDSISSSEEQEAREFSISPRRATIISGDSRTPEDEPAPTQLDVPKLARPILTKSENASARDLAVRVQQEPDEWELVKAGKVFDGSSSATPATNGPSSNSAELAEDHARAIVQEYRRQSLLAQGPSPSALLSGDNVLAGRKNYRLQKVDPFFTDPTGQYHHAFEAQLQTLKGNNSESKHCIEEYLMKSEKKFFSDYRNAKLGYRMSASTAVETVDPRYPSGTTIFGSSRALSEKDAIEGKDEAEEDDTERQPLTDENILKDPWQLGEDYIHPTGIRRWMQIRLGDWPVYAFFLAFGQVIAANSYQIVLLTGQVGEAATQVYIISVIYILASIFWWIIFRTMGSRSSLSLPYFFYGLAFILVAFSRYATTGTPRSWVNHTSSGAYAVASAAGTFFFVLNFGDEGGSQVRAWVFRACVIQGSQQVYVTVLWFWGYHVNAVSANGDPSPQRTFANTPGMTAIALPIGLGLWGIGLLCWYGLPNYYRQTPGVVPHFYRTVWRRKIVIWFFITVMIQNFFLSPQYGRSWTFLFSSNHATWWQVYILVVFFFVVVWITAMWLFSFLTFSHTWILPIFAIGLGAPRWAQIWWGTSGMALWLPWAPGGYIGSALIARALWLWLGLLDMIQGVGIGMILLSTLTRIHVLFTLIVAQVLGAAATAVARACAPDKLGPAPVFPDITSGVGSMGNAWFWIGLILNLAIEVGFFKFFRKEQLTKP